jgi:hypothetical protein
MDKKAAIQLLSDLQAAFPSLKSTLRRDDPNVDAMLATPAQEGFPFELCLYHVGDELHLTAGEGFWLEWFPSSWPKVVEDYREAASGLLSGRYRVVEYRRRGRPVKAYLQEPKGKRWRTIGSWSKAFTVTWGATPVVLRADPR